MSVYIHESAFVDDGAQIGNGTKIWHFCHVMPGAVIGEGCTLGQNVFVGNRVTIGSNVKIQNNVSVYDGVILEDDVFCGPSMVFTNVITPRSAFPVTADQYATTHVKRGVSIGANATIVCGVTVHEWAMIGAGAVVTKDVAPYSLIAGVPGRVIGYVSQRGERLDFDEDCIAVCPVSGDRYQQSDDGSVMRVEA